jgi:hypothetical protein
MFPQPRPTDLITVPSCEKCNNNLSLDDEYFRINVAAISGDSPQSMTLLKQRIIPRTRKKPGLAIRLLLSVRHADVYNEGGVYTGRGPAVTLDRPRMQAVINKIVRGLFLKHTGRSLPMGHMVRDYVLSPTLSEHAQQEVLKLPLFKVGDGSVFNYCYCVDAGTSESVWFLMFYDDRVLFVTNTGGTEDASH